MELCVIIPAAGRSARFGGGDKLGQDLGGRALLLRTVELFSKRDDVKSIVVAGPPDDFDEFQAKYAATLSFHGATLVEGGRAERWETVRNALAAVPDTATHVAVHDAARPATPADLLDRLFEAAGQVEAVIPVVPLAGTVKRVAADVRELGGDDDAVADAILGAATRVTISARAVEETLDRRGLVDVQTPQVFAADLLRRAYAGDDLDGATDDATLVERLGETVWTVPGDPRNLKVTRPADLPLVRAILGLRPPAERPVHKRF
ncbi:MAG: IspD/TarI family cytidylyltransferase [Planctomycetota bacterium]|jgi:2-C-methyl-D-erythritol 4-phosphate cytidylyltransferase